MNCKFVSLILSATITILSTVAMTSCSGNDADKGFVKVNPDGFTVDGEPYSFVGMNFWYGAILGSEGEGGDRDRLNAELDFLKELGIDNLRVLVGGDGPDGIFHRIRPTLQKEPGVYNDTILAGLDYLLNQLAARDMKAILYLNNTWEWSGGYSQYLEWTGHGTAPDPTTDGYNAFCDYASKYATCPEAHELFLNHIDNIVTRTNSINGVKYIDDPAIMAWEVCNEPRPFGDESNKQAFKDWLSKSSQRIRQHDPNHLITTGSEGYYGCGVDLELFEVIHADPNIDYLTIHIWPKNWGWIGDCPNEENLSDAVTRTHAYIDLHSPISHRLQKPMVLEEFGYPRDSGSFEPGSPTTLRDLYFDATLSMVKECGLAGCNIWAWGGFGQPSDGHIFWELGDDYTGDPAQEEQGLYSIFAGDSTTINIIRRHTLGTR